MVSNGALLGLGISIVLALAWPFVAYWLVRGRMVISARNILIGGVLFILFALVLESSLHAYLLVKNPVTAAWFKDHKIAFAIYAALAAGLFEETARYLGLSYLARRKDGLGAGVAYGIGHGGAESIALGALGTLQFVVLAILLNMGQFDTVLGSKLPAATLAQVRESLTQLTFLGALPGGIERATAMVLQMALSLLVWRAVERRSLAYFLAAVLCHFGFDFPAALIQAKLIHLSVWQIEAGYGALAALIFVYLMSRRPPKIVKPSAV
jgi:uncharacterized membrane protein YhfC